MSRVAVPSIDPVLGTAATPMAFVRPIVLAYRRYGVDPGEALRAARIPASQLDNPEMRVTGTQMVIMSSTAMRELDDEALGWFSRKLPWGTHGMLCRASICSPNLLIALRRWCGQYRLLADEVSLALKVDQPIASVELELKRDLGEMLELCAVTMLRNALGFACWAIDSRISLTNIRFPFPSPPHSEFYHLIFSCPVHFNCDTTGFSFDAQYLSIPVCRDEMDTRLMLKKGMHFSVFQYHRDRLLVQRLRQLLRTGMDKISWTAELVADRLHVSTRTLHRQLHEEGVSFLQIKSEVRCDRAINMLTHTTLSVARIAEAVGFGNEKSFLRAFKQWTGRTPGSYRERPRE